MECANHTENSNIIIAVSLNKFFLQGGRVMFCVDGIKIQPSLC
jgi:hypothetical protein